LRAALSFSRAKNGGHEALSISWRTKEMRSFLKASHLGCGDQRHTPLDLAIVNQVDRFSLAIDVIDRVPALNVTGAHAKEKLRNMQIDCQNYAYENGVDKPENDQWTWPY
jgi:phosphoketolase